MTNIYINYAYSNIDIDIDILVDILTTYILPSRYTAAPPRPSGGSNGSH